MFNQIFTQELEIVLVSRGNLCKWFCGIACRKYRLQVSYLSRVKSKTELQIGSTNMLEYTLTKQKENVNNHNIQKERSN